MIFRFEREYLKPGIERGKIETERRSKSVKKRYQNVSKIYVTCHALLYGFHRCILYCHGHLMLNEKKSEHSYLGYLWNGA